MSESNPMMPPASMLPETMVNDLNLDKLQALNQPCAGINARHDRGSDAAKVLADEVGDLEPHVVLAKKARNIWQNQGLVNATTGVVEDIIWPSESLSRSEPPIAVLVSCKTYTVKGQLYGTQSCVRISQTGIPIPSNTFENNL